MKKLVILTSLVLLCGCVQNKGWQGLVPGKDVRMRGVTVLVATPWGTQTLKIDELDSRTEASTNNLPVLPKPKL